MDGLKIAVLIKQVPDTAEIIVDQETGTLRRSGVSAVLNPYCEFALDAAVVLAEDNPGSVITVLTMGPPSAREVCMRARALGADRAVLLTDRMFAGADCWATSTVLTRALSVFCPNADIILCGSQAIDGGTAHIPPELAVRAGIPFLGDCERVNVVGADASLRCEADCEDDRGRHHLSASLPALCAVSSGSRVRRMPSLCDVAAVSGEHIITADAADLGLERNECGLRGSPTRVVSITAPETYRDAVTVDGEEQPESAVDMLFDLLSGERGGVQ